jgi:hypothetical protein
VGSGRRCDLAAALLLLFLGIGLAAPHFWSQVQWSPDGLFYAAQTEEVGGESQAAALDKVFSSPLADREKQHEVHEPPSLRRVDDPEWVTYSAQFYRRRWTLPVAGAALKPLVGDRDLEDVSLLGLILLGPLLFFFLRSAFPVTGSAIAAGFCLLLPPVLALAPHPGTDYLGLATLIAALIALLRVEKGGWIAMAVWVALMLLLSFTRDEVIVALTGSAALAWIRHSRRLWIAVALGVAAYLPSVLLFKVPLQENLAYVLNEYRIPTQTGWGHILSAYPKQMAEVLYHDLHYPLETAIPPLTALMGLVVVAGMVFLFRRRAPLEDLAVVARGAVVGAIATILVSMNYTQLRLEYVFIPAAAVGIAALVTASTPKVMGRLSGPQVANGRPTLS